MIDSDELTPFLKMAVKVYLDYSHYILKRRSSNDNFIKWFFSLGEDEQNSFVNYINGRLNG